MNTEIPVVIAFTPNYFVPAATCLYSILKHSRDGESFRFICLSSEELPEQMLLRSENNEIEFSFVSNLTGNNLTMIYKHKVNATLFPYDLYPLLHEMYTRIADKNNEMIVLKKKS